VAAGDRHLHSYSRYLCAWAFAYRVSASTGFLIGLSVSPDFFGADLDNVIRAADLSLRATSASAGCRPVTSMLPEKEIGVTTEFASMRQIAWELQQSI